MNTQALTDEASVKTTAKVAQTLNLDDASIRPEDLSIGTLTRELNLQKRPFWLLRKLMDSLESKRQTKGMGWSRPWNKTGLNVFRTHTQKPAEDKEYFQAMMPFMEFYLAKVPTSYRDFAWELFMDTNLMAFTFYHTNQVEYEQYEGLTLSLGRKVPSDKTKRDRLDLILEDLRVDGRVDGKVDRVRIKVCPWSSYQNDKTLHSYENRALMAEDHAVAQPLYESCVKHYQLWKDQEDRQWSHWSSNYISYFGARSFIPQGTAFD